MNVDMNGYYTKADNIVAREIEGELVIVPVSSGIGSLDSELFSLNSTANMIWQKLDGHASLKDIVDAVTQEYDSTPEQIKKDIMVLVGQLLDKKLIIKNKM